MSLATKTTQDCILGALVGAIVGDAAGVTLEFHIGEITPKHTTKAMCMSGGGGALHGCHSIPKYMKDPVLSFDPTQIDPYKSLLGRPRPAAYKPANILQFATKI